MELSGKKILITGAATGIGRSIAEKLVKTGIKPALISRRTELLEDFESAGCLVIRCDVGKKEEVKEAFQETAEKQGIPDITILNAGMGKRSTIKNFSSADAEETFATNLMGNIYWIEHLLPEMMKRKSGIIAGVSSLADNRGFSGSGLYCSSKAALSIFLEGLRREAADYGIKIITIKPGFVKTPMTDKNNFKMPFLMSPEKAAGIILKGIRKEKRIIQFPLPTVIGTKLVSLIPPGLFDKMTGYSDA